MNNLALLGMFAALSASITWGLNSLLFTYAGGRVGSDVVTHVRLWLALVAILIIHSIVYLSPIPHHLESRQIFFLCFSGASGFVLGDMFLFEAFILIGTQSALLIKTLAPALAAFMSILFLGEMLTFWQILSISVTLTGIALVIVRSSPKKAAAADHADPHAVPPATKIPLKGIFYALLGALGQAGAVVLAKPAMSGDLSALSATVIRLLAATPLMMIVVLARGRLGHHLRVVLDRRASLAIFSGTMLGTVLGVIMAMFAVKNTHVGIASTLMELSPVVVLLVSTIFLGQKYLVSQWVGTALALLGSVLLLSGQ